MFMKIKFRHIVLGVFALLIISIVIDFSRHSSYTVFPSRPLDNKPSEIYKIYFELANGSSEIDWNRILYDLEYINSQYDCADFKLTTLVRILYEYPSQIPSDILRKIHTTLFNFRYWMDEPNGNGMCYWSENHQILFASSEYLVGQMYPDSVFTNDNRTGLQHMQSAKVRIMDWLEMRWNYGFTEFYSNVYYSEDIGAMINLIDHAHDNEIVIKTSIIMDLLIYDIATQKIGNMFVSTSGRAYEKGRKGDPYASYYNITNYLWSPTKPAKPHLNYGFLTSESYSAPPVLLEIGKDKNSVVIKQSNGLNISELKNEGYFGSDNKSIMMQWGMEAFTNKEIVRNSLAYIRKQNMFNNEFLKDFKDLDFTIFRLLHLEPVTLGVLSPQSDGLAIQRANTYTYKTKDYSIYTVQNHFPGMNAIQHHVAGMNLGDSFAIFHLHPAVPDSVKLHSPNYWVGYGRLPHAVQEKNISLAIYNLPEKKNIMELDMVNFTHAYFPTELFDSTIIRNKYAFGKKDSAYCALIGRNDLILNSNNTDDIIQDGRQVYWIIEAGSKEEDGSFKNFYNRIINNKVNFDEESLVLEYNSRRYNFVLKYDDSFTLNGEIVNTHYDRFDSPYVKAGRKAKTMEFNFNDKFLFLDYYNLKREFNK